MTRAGLCRLENRIDILRRDAGANEPDGIVGHESIADFEVHANGIQHVRHTGKIVD